MSAPNIPDGRTRNGKIEARPGVHAETDFVYRLALPEQVYDWQKKIAATRTGKEELAANASFLAKHLVSWERVREGSDGPEAEPVSEAAIRGLHHLEITALLNHATGYTPPQLEADEKN